MKRYSNRWLTIAAVAVSFAASVEPLRADPAEEGAWSTASTWGSGGGVEAVHTFLLPTGKVLFWSTYAVTNDGIGIWDPTTGVFSVAGNAPSHNIFCSGHTWLPDGRLLVVGGQTTGAYNGEQRADIYNPFTNLWANADPNQDNVPNMGPGTGQPNGTNTAVSGKRWYPSATTLGNGDVLVTSGDVTQQGVTNRTVQVYEYATNSWRTLTGALRPSDDILPEYPRIFLAPDGRAISMSDNSNDTEWLDLSGTGSWTYMQDTLDSNLHNYGPAVMYDTGKVAYIGGGHQPTRNISMIDLMDEDPSWRYGGGGTTPHPANSPYVMAEPRRQNNATILADGTVLITGGTNITDWNNPNGLVEVAEIWDPETEQIRQVAAANPLIYRGYHSTGLLLPDGRVLVTGGDHDYGGPIPGVNTNAEIYSPDYLFAEDGSPAVRPTVASAPDVAELGSKIFVETPDAASIAKALWVVPGAVTHAHNWAQRANVFDLASGELTIEEDGVSIKLPKNANEAPIGYYMLFLVNEDGTPSMAHWIQATPYMPLPGDYNDDHVVNAADYTVWRDAMGTMAELPNDDTAGVTMEDYAVWKDHYGMTDLGGAGGISLAGVPEPASFALAILGCLALTAINRSPRRV